MASASCSSQVNNIKAKKFKKIPIFVVENHNDVLELLLPALANNYLQFQDNLMIHFDSHPDCCVPRLMPAEAVFNRTELLESLSIENWIIPLAYGGLFNEIVWVHQSFANQIPEGIHDFEVGERNGKICVTSKLDYFLSDGSYAEESQIENKKNFKLHSTRIGTSFNDIIQDRPYILDIDLDYFSTLNPFTSIYPKANTYEKLSKIFYIEKDYDINDAKSVENFVQKRNKQLDFFETIFQHMAQHGSLEKFKLTDESMKEKFEQVKDLIECLIHNYSMYDIDWFVINDAGCTVDEEQYQLPNHESSVEEIKKTMKEFEHFIASLTKLPEIITISRSCEDGYTPKHQIELIQTQVLKALKIFGAQLCDAPTLWYKNSSDISALELVEPRTKRV